MRGRDVQFTEFVAERGAALWRTASLLEPDDSDAEATLVVALARTRRQWATASREARVEVETRESLYREVIDRHKQSRVVESIGSESAADTPVERRALLTLSVRERIALVLTVYDGVAYDEAVGLLKASVSEIAELRATGERKLRDELALPASTPTLALLNAAASKEVPADLAERAASVRPKVQNRPVVVALAVVAAIAVVVAVAPWSRDASDAAGVSALGMPTALPTGHNLPTLAESPIESASTAYVVNGIPLVTEATTGSARLVFERDPSPDWFDDGEPGVTQLFVRARWTQAVLSPDGQWLVLVQAVRGRVGGKSSQTFLVDLSTGTPTLVRDIVTQPDPVGAGGIPRPRIAWSRESDGFACVCGRTLSILTIEGDGGDTKVRVNPTPITTDAIAGGLPGLAVRDLDRGWWIVNRPSAATDTISEADALAMTYYNRVLYLTAEASTIYALGSDRDVDGGRCTLWNSYFAEPIAIEPFPERDGWLCTPMTMQSGQDGIVLILKSNDSDPEEEPVDVVYVQQGGELTNLGQFPEGTTAASLAAQLVG